MAGPLIRSATPQDAESIAWQRGRMFVDMGDLSPEQALAQQQMWVDWFRQALAAGSYLGWLAERGGEVIGGVGLLLRPKLPSLGDPGLWQGYIMNMYVAPEQRRQGGAEALLQAAVAQAQAQGIRSMALHAAPLGRGIYQRAGFTEAPNPELRLTLPPETP